MNNARFSRIFFQDFPNPGIFKKKSRTFQKAWEACNEQCFLDALARLSEKTSSEKKKSVKKEMMEKSKAIKGRMLQRLMGEGRRCRSQ